MIRPTSHSGSAPKVLNRHYNKFCYDSPSIKTLLYPVILTGLLLPMQFLPADPTEYLLNAALRGDVKKAEKQLTFRDLQNPIN